MDLPPAGPKSRSHPASGVTGFLTGFCGICVPLLPLFSTLRRASRGESCAGFTNDAEYAANTRKTLEKKGAICYNILNCKRGTTQNATDFSFCCFCTVQAARPRLGSLPRITSRTGERADRFHASVRQHRLNRCVKKERKWIFCMIPDSKA